MRADLDFGLHHLLTASRLPVLVRRGDPLSGRAHADQPADVVVTQLRNQVPDGVSMTIIAWYLVGSHEVFHASGGRGVLTGSESTNRYAWLRPPELMWVARAIGIASGRTNRGVIA